MGASNASDTINDRMYDAMTCPKKMIVWKWWNRLHYTGSTGSRLNLPHTENSNI